MPRLQREAVGQVSWSVVLLICGVLTYVGVLEELGTIDYVGEAITQVGAPTFAALLISYIGAIVSAFASSTGMLAATIPLAVPFLQEGAVGAIGVVTAVAISTTVVDASPLSTNGALVLANARNVDRDVLFRHLLAYGAVVAVVAAPLAWFVFVVFGIGSKKRLTLVGQVQCRWGDPPQPCEAPVHQASVGRLGDRRVNGVREVRLGCTIR